MICGVISICRRGRAGCAKAAPGNAVDMMRRCKLGCELIEHMSIESRTRQKDQRTAVSAPIQNLQLHILIHGYELHFMRGSVRSLCRPLLAVQCVCRKGGKNDDPFRNLFHRKAETQVSHTTYVAFYIR